MIEIIRESKPKARKRYRCEACEFLQDELGWETFTLAECRLIVKARRNGWCIVPGRQYIRQFNTDGCDTWTFRAIPEMHELCIKHDLYPKY